MEDQRTLGTKAEVFWPIEKTLGLGKDQVEGTKERGGPSRQWERDILDVFDTSPTDG